MTLNLTQKFGAEISKESYKLALASARSGVESNGRVNKMTDERGQKGNHSKESTELKNREENLKVLFDYSKDAFNEERNIFRDLENKAAKYLTVFTLLLAAAGFFANWLGIKILHPKTCLEWGLLANGLALLSIVFVSWLVIFLVLKIGNFEEFPLDQSTIDFFLQTPIQQVYKEFSCGLKKAMEKNAETRARKAKLLKWGHNLIITTWILLLLFTTLFILNKASGAVDRKKSDSARLESTNSDKRNHPMLLDIRGQLIYTVEPFTAEQHERRRSLVMAKNEKSGSKIVRIDNGEKTPPPEQPGGFQTAHSAEK